MKRTKSILFAGLLAGGVLHGTIGNAQQPAAQPAEQVAPAPAEKPPGVIPPPPAEAAAPAPAPAEKPLGDVKQEPAPAAPAATAPAAPPHPSPIGPTAAPTVPGENTPPPQPIPTTPPDPNDNFPALRTGSSHDPPPTDVATSPLPPFEGETGHAAAHGAGHQGPLIQNWWSWSYGPGTPYEHPPFGFALINFAVFLAILARVFGKSFVDFLRTRHNEVRRALDRAREIQQNAEKHLRQLEERSRNLEAEIAELLANYRRLAESERAAIVQRAEAEAQSLLKDAESQAKAAINSAKRDLERQTALLAVDLAEKIIKSRLTDEDQKRLNERYIADVEGLSRKPAATAASHVSPAPKGNPS